MKIFKEFVVLTDSSNCNSVEQEVLEREIARLRTLYQQQKQPPQQQPPSGLRHTKSKDLDSQFSNLSLKHKDSSSGRDPMTGPVRSQICAVLVAVFFLYIQPMLQPLRKSRVFPLCGIVQRLPVQASSFSACYAYFRHLLVFPVSLLKLILILMGTWRSQLKSYHILIWVFLSDDLPEVVIHSTSPVYVIHEVYPSFLL